MKYAERLDADDANFSARRAPRKTHYRIVECEACGLVYSNPIYPQQYIQDLYRDTSFHIEDQMENYLHEYNAEFRRAFELLGGAERVLEVGCANGYFLRILRDMGIPHFVGVEPCVDAKEKADPDIQPHIVVEDFHDGLFEPDSFDIVCIFQVLDHLTDPAATMETIARVVRPGGLVVTVNHNVRSWMPRVLGEGCPMFDVQHIYLFDHTTHERLLEKAGLECLRVQNLSNHYGLAYAIKMLPVLPLGLRSVLIRILKALRVDELRFRVPAGNMAALGRKPMSPER